MKVEGWLFVLGVRLLRRSWRRLLAAGPRSRPARRRWPSRRAWPSWSATTCCSPPAASTRGRRTTRTPRSPTAPASWASSARTAGGRCSWRLPRRSAFLGIVFGWWLFIIGAVGGHPGRDRVGLRVLPGRARPLSRPRTRHRPGAAAWTPGIADSLPVAARNWTDARATGQTGAGVFLVRSVRTRTRRQSVGVRGRPAGRAVRAARRALRAAVRPGGRRRPAAGQRLHLDGSPTPAAQAAATPTPPAVSQATIDLHPASASVDVPVDQPVMVTASDGTLTSVTADRRQGPRRRRRAVRRRHHLDARPTRCGSPTTTASSRPAVDADGVASSAAAFFATVDAAQGRSRRRISPLGGQSVGVGMPIIVRFNTTGQRPGRRRAGAAGHQPQAGRGRLELGQRHRGALPAQGVLARQRQVTLDVNLKDVNAGHGVWGMENRTVKFQHRLRRWSASSTSTGTR